jgi:hypothetical protein
MFDFDCYLNSLGPVGRSYGLDGCGGVVLGLAHRVILRHGRRLLVADVVVVGNNPVMRL